MQKGQKQPSRTAVQIIAVFALLVVLALLYTLGNDESKASGTVLILELENSENIHQYWVFNPYNKTIDECQSSAKQAIAQILASDAVPKDSRVTSWRCSLKPPENDK